MLRDGISRLGKGIANLRRRIYGILEATDPGLLARLINLFIMALIILNAVAVVLESVEEIYIQYDKIFGSIESISLAVFALEYLLRAWTCTVDPSYANPVKGRIKFALSPLALIDLMVILPFFLPDSLLDLRMLRAVRIFWILKLLRIGRYSRAMATLENVLRAKKEELMITFFAIVLFLVFASSIIYYIEHSVQPQNFPSIPATMWWALLTLTTIGYDDIYPQTVIGKIVGSLIIIMGVGMFALPTGILASGFIEELQRRRDEGEEESPSEGGLRRRLPTISSLRRR